MNAEMKHDETEVSHPVVRALTLPVHVVTNVVHKSASHIQKKHIRFAVGGSFMFAGSSLAIGSSSFAVPHFIHIAIDVIAYGIHGLGCTPFMVILVRKLKLEDDVIEVSPHNKGESK